MSVDRLPTRILICDPIAQIDVDMLREHFAVDLKPGINPGDLLDTVHKYDAVVVRRKLAWQARPLALSDLEESANG